MKSTGIVRKIDDFGRIVIPKEIRRLFELKENSDALEIFVDENTIILKKYEPSCIFCQNARDIQIYKGRNICSECLKELAQKGSV